MKTLIEPVTGIVCAGHVALRIDGACIIQAPDDRAKKLEHLLSIKGKPDRCDRMVSASSFVEATGCTIFRAGKIYKPKRTVKKSRRVDVTNLLRE